MNIPDALPVLSAGHHPWGSGKACVMDAISWLSGRTEWGDAPECVHPVIRSVAIRVNDRLPDSERHQLWALVPDMMGTAPADPDSLEARVVSVRLAAWCARQVLHLVRPQDRDVCERAILASERWADAPGDEAEAAAAAWAAEAAAAAWAAAAAAKAKAAAAWASAEAEAWAAEAAAAAWAAAAKAKAAWAAAAEAAAWAAAAAAKAKAAAAKAKAAALDLLRGLVAHHKELTGHQPRDVTDEEWSGLCSALGVT